MNRVVTTGVCALVVTGMCVGGAVDATAAPTAAAHHDVSRTDAKFLKTNEQVNLAEIDLGKIVLKRSKGPRAKQLARVTIRDHARAAVADAKLAKKYHVTLPTEPNSSQRAAAAELSTTKKVALYYFKVQIAGHITSIEQTKHEIADGHNAAIRKYAKVYLVVAEDHLRMARQDLKHYRATH